MKIDNTLAVPCTPHVRLVFERMPSILPIFLLSAIRVRAVLLVTRLRVPGHGCTGSVNLGSVRLASLRVSHTRTHKVLATAMARSESIDINRMCIQPLCDCNSNRQAYESRRSGAPMIMKQIFSEMFG
eukprot:4836699-Prymnesium_polylepis.3